ncbi:presenilin enhancer, gamma-secretase subunit [Haematobia irritans]|uniref:presenilin enhancer, gamma-secretase subunit n=1 Tax=Haematobia irritans TaxID=7368 RepID=UPI003F50C854
MNISKATGEQKLQLCRTYFRAGFALLPFLWAVNFFWFFKEAFVMSSFPEQRTIKQYVIFSGLGTLLWTIVLTIWVIIFQTQRSEWGATADYMSFIIPLGKP